MEQLLQFLMTLHPLSTNLRDHLQDTLSHQVFPRKSMLLKAGQICKSISFVNSGMVRCYYEMNDTEVSSWFMKEGDVIISVESFYRQTKSIESIQALEDLDVYTLTYDQLQATYKIFPEFNIIGRVLTERYYTLSEQRLYSIRMQKALLRYRFLRDHHPELIKRVPSKYLASYLGISRETLSRIRGAK